MHSIQLIKKLNATVNWDIVEFGRLTLSLQRTIGTADQNRAGTAITFGTNDLCANQAATLPQIFRQRLERGFAVNYLFSAIQEKSDVITHGDSNGCLRPVSLSW